MDTVEKTAHQESFRAHLHETVYFVLENCLRGGEDVREKIAEVRELLEAIPLSTSEFGLATVRLDNAERYLDYAEPGAARYELRLLAGSLGGFLKTDSALWSAASDDVGSICRRPLKWAKI